ncbi:hypothetical protein [Antrihabitans cavernicola]|uniref:Uncharacterized protein n=1 Tax=Antrihabitans cavernicola TaxID=2495913 RepID=A0A5A7SL86_9NOCA|nr:hypothetical protein [Spelaeibacter cavernicola]KAA0025001.1 hypothetical protein FOY51_03555 [Spelaeibacter cavernicola]
MGNGHLAKGAVRAAVATAAIAPMVAIGIAAGTGSVSAAQAPSISIASVGNGAYTVTWDSHDPKSPCTAHITSDGQPERLSPLTASGTNTGSLPGGRTQLFVDCGTAGRSLTVSAYAPSNPVNDILTLFSSGLAGFGIQAPF